MAAEFSFTKRNHMKNIRDAHLQTQSVHAGTLKNETGAVVTPIYQTSTFEFDSADHGARLFSGKEKGFIYTRLSNPTLMALEETLTVLEDGHKALATSSGMAAISTALSAILKAGDHVVCSNAVYGPTSSLMDTLFSKYNIDCTFVEMSDTNEIKKALKPNTKVVFLETPANPTLTVIDIKAAAALAKSVNAKLIVDNTFMSPILQKPLNLGADIVVHSMTKFINGHADVVAGAIILKNEEDFMLCRKELNLLGAVIDPHQAWLVQRGIKTLAIRMERHCENAQAVAEWLENHPAVKTTWYPGLPGHAGHELAKKQQTGMGGMIAFELNGGLEAGKKLMDSVNLIKLAVSLGGVESLIQHPASMTHAGMDPQVRLDAGITDGLVRISIGIENVNDLIADLENGLS
jgi:methionine-gamma-lyase